ncbi:unnamed protein product [Effrenium voratum]|nr:unnamed protein product [Effrenium voratum]
MASRAWRLLRLACLAHLGCLVLRLAYGFAARPLLPRGARRVRRASLGTAEAQDIHAAVRRKALEAIATGDLAPGQELELISALDLGTVPWALLPVRFKERLGLPLADRGIDSLALNLSVAVQAKDYAGGVPLHRLTNFHYLVKAEGSPLRDHVRQLVVATTDATELPQLVAWSNMTHRRYTEEEMESWRNLARREVLLQQARAKAKPRWQHQVACLRSCQQFLNASGRDFFVQMATGTGKSLVMSDLLFDVVSKGGRACVVVPKLDLMQQMAQLLEETLPHHHVCRVGTGWQADFAAEVFVCVRNSAWQLQSLTLDLLLLDEAHHYEPLSNVPNMPNTPALADLGVHARHVLSLQAGDRGRGDHTLLGDGAGSFGGRLPATPGGSHPRPPARPQDLGLLQHGR